MPLNFRCYHFCNYYLSPLQNGIQSAHAQVELFNKYVFNDDQNQISSTFNEIAILKEWAMNDKTMICLNGGNCDQLKDIICSLQCINHQFPWASFNEDTCSLNGALTNVTVILPEYIYNHDTNNINSNQYINDLHSLISDKRLIGS